MWSIIVEHFWHEAIRIALMNLFLIYQNSHEVWILQNNEYTNDHYYHTITIPWTKFWRIICSYIFQWLLCCGTLSSMLTWGKAPCFITVSSQDMESVTISSYISLHTILSPPYKILAWTNVYAINVSNDNLHKISSLMGPLWMYPCNINNLLYFW